jgi:protein-tyrosine phosphatase
MFVLKRGVDAALPIIADGWKVLVHCKYGVHRSVAMACCILIGTGHSADEAMRLVAERRAAADPHAGYVQKRIRKFETEWRKLYPLQ